jgi:hypothetical protein
MPNLRELAAADLKTQNLNDWSLPIILIAPDGELINTDNETGEVLKAVQILYDRRKLDPATGEEITVHEPIISVTKSSLSRIPIPGEKWIIKIPISPREGAALETRQISGDRSIESGDSLDFIRLYPGKVIQS